MPLMDRLSDELSDALADRPLLLPVTPAEVALSLTQRTAFSLKNAAAYVMLRLTTRLYHRTLRMPSAPRIRLFGVANLERERSLEPIAAPAKAVALLGFLACQREPATRAQLAALLWGETTEWRSRRNLTHTLGQIAAMLPGCLRAEPQRVGWAADSTIWTDVHVCAALLEPVEHAVGRLDLSDERVARLEQSVALYRGELLAGIAPPGCVEFETWLVRERERWRRQMIDSLTLLTRYHAHHGRTGPAEGYARRLIELEPWNEEGHRALMLLLAYSSRRSEAVVHYERLQRMLAVELGVAPTDDTRRLYERIRAGTWAQGRSGPEGNEAQPSGALAPHATVVRPHLHRPALPFVGRARELDDLTARLRAPDARLVTLVAPGGMGKTRLALAAAERLAQQHIFRDGVAFADLASIDTIAELESALTEALGLPLDSRCPSRRQLLDYLRSKQLLLLLDNCEQLLGDLAELAASILHEAPEVRLLATSRERLGLQAERVLPLEGMDTHDDGAALFAASARFARPDFALDAQSRPLVQAICAQVSGMPLAIELAARWTNTLSLAAINDELAHSHALLASRARDTARRHRSVRAVCEASWVQLQPRDQAVFAQLAVFRGGATRQAIQTVTGATLWQLQTLVERALLHFDPRSERYTVHELLRQYAAEQLAHDAPEEQAARRRHAVYFLGALAACEQALKGARQWETLATINADSENLRAAWRWATETHSVDLLASATGALSLTYAWLGHHEEGLTAMELATAALSCTTPQPAAILRATLLIAQARFALLCSQRTQALDLLGQAEALLPPEGSGDSAAEAARAGVLLECGRSLAHQDFAGAHDALTRSRALHKALGDQWGEATALAELGYLLTSMSHNYGEAKALLEQSVASYRALGDQIGLSEALLHLCRTNRNIGDFPQALTIAHEVYAIAEANGNARLLAQAGTTLGMMLAIGNQYQEAYTTLTAALRLTYELGRRSELPNLYCALGYVASFLGNYSEARNAYNDGLHVAQQLNDELERCSLLSGLAGTALAEGAYAEALQLAEEAIALSDRLGEIYLRSRTLPYRALAMRRLGVGDCGRRDALTTLRLGLTARSEILVALWVVALLLADAGELTRTAEVFALSEGQRRLDNVWVQAIALRELRALAAELPPQVVAQAHARWAQQDVWSALEELCAELETVWFPSQ